MPLQILTDRGANFESQLFNALLQRVGIDHARTTAYKPSTNGQVERFHRTLNSVLGKVVAENQRDWEAHLPYAVAAYRATVHESTGYSPNFLMFGHEVRAPLDIVMGLPPHSAEPAGTVDEFVNNKLGVMRAAYESVRNRLKRSADQSGFVRDRRPRLAVQHTPQARDNAKMAAALYWPIHRARVCRPCELPHQTVSEVEGVCRACGQTAGLHTTRHSDSVAEPWQQRITCPIRKRRQSVG